MCAAKKKKRKRGPIVPVWLRRSASLVWGPGRSFTLIVLMCVGLAGAWYAVWHFGGVREHVLASEKYMLRPDKVEITPLPPWIDRSRDLRLEVLRNASLDGPLSIMDEDLTQRIRQAFAMHAWVARVVQVAKHPPARVTVELVYRKPVCVVEVEEDRFLVDKEGIRLPKDDFSPLQLSRYPCLQGVQTRPIGTIGEYWGDPKVTGGAEIAAALMTEWESLGLRSIRPASPRNGQGSGETHYELLTLRGIRVFWGRAPGSTIPGDMPAVEKVARLKKHKAEYGALVPRRNGSQMLDVYRLGDARVSSRPQDGQPTPNR